MPGKLPIPVPFNRDHRYHRKEIAMKLVYDVIEDNYDDTTQIRSMTEQAQMPSGDWLIRTTVYTPHHISMDVVRVKGKKGKSLFKTLR
jgi:ribosome maturation protein Sdo1